MPINCAKTSTANVAATTTRDKWNLSKHDESKMKKAGLGKRGRGHVTKWGEWSEVK